jgi:hypothetical protein
MQYTVIRSGTSFVLTVYKGTFTVRRETYRSRGLALMAGVRHTAVKQEVNKPIFI